MEDDLLRRVFGALRGANHLVPCQQACARPHGLPRTMEKGDLFYFPKFRLSGLPLMETELNFNDEAGLSFVLLAACGSFARLVERCAK